MFEKDENYKYYYYLNYYYPPILTLASPILAYLQNNKTLYLNQENITKDEQFKKQLILT